MEIKKGQRIIVEKMPEDSFYLKAQGIVDEVKNNGWVTFIADKVKWISGQKNGAITLPHAERQPKSKM